MKTKITNQSGTMSLNASQLTHAKSASELLRFTRFAALAFMFVFGAAAGWAATENFSNLPTTSSSSYQSRSWTGTDGVTWTAEGARTDQTINGKAICFGTSTTANRWVTSPTYGGGMGTLTFNYVRAFTGTGARTLQVFVNGVQFGSDITVTPTSDTVVGYSANVNVSGDVVLQIRSTGASQVKVDDVAWNTYSPLSTEPTTDAHSVSFANVQSGQMDASWTSGDGASRIVVAKAGSAPTGVPVDGTGYTANATYGSVGTALGDGYVVYSGSGSTFTLTGLAPSTTYYLIVYEFNGSGSSANYLTSGTPGSGSQATSASANSTASDIVRASGFSEAANVDYASYQATDITDANSIELARFTIRDGAGSADADSASTTLDAVSFTVANGASLRRVALYDGTTEIAEVAGGASVGFSGLAGLVAADDGTKNFSVRATFNASVTDNQQFQFTVSSATANAGGSTFAAADAGGAASDTTGDANRIEVTATKLAFSSVPTTATVGANFSATVQAQDANNNLDLDDATSVTITLASGSGTLTGGGAQNLASGVQTWATLQIDTGGSFTLQAAGGSLTSATSSSITAAITTVQTANFSPLILPQVMPSGTSTRLPVLFRATVSGLAASTTYRYYTQAAASTDFGTTGVGAGIVVLVSANGATFATASTGSLTTAGSYETFTTDGSGQYTGWFGFGTSGNARFAAGATLYPCVTIGDNSGTLVARWAMTTGIQVLTFSASAGANNGSGIRGSSSAAAKDFVALYDNTAGTGRPLAVTYVESEGFSLASLAGYYGTTGTGPVDGIAGAWGTIIPNTLANGVQRIARYNNAGSLIIAYTDADGVWPSGANTVNPAGGTTAIEITATDARLNNQSPVANDDATEVQLGAPVTIATAKLLTNDTDADGDTLTITDASATSGTAAAVGGDIQYTPPGSGSSDTITYTVSDGHGGTDTATVAVTLLAAPDEQGFNKLAVNGSEMTYLGIPGQSYVLEYTELLSPASWGPVITNQAATNGYLRFTNSQTGYFRTKHLSAP